jgi:aminoglycoside phosphotransferase (APT) family kinase protein
VTLVAVEDGYDFKVLLVDDEWVFRFARRHGFVAALETEIALLPKLGTLLPVAVPQFEHVSRDPPFVVYRLIQGEPLVDEDPGGVRAFLDALHAFDARGLGVPAPVWAEAYAEQCAEFGRVVSPLLDPDERAVAAALFADVETLIGFEPVLLHGDLGPEHLLCRSGRLVGVIDWGDARLGDPALDYAWLLSGPFPDWDVDDGLRTRARFYHRLAPWFEAHYGLFTNRPAHVERGLAGIRSRL